MLRLSVCADRGMLVVLAESAIPTLPLLEFFNSLEQVHTAKIRPQGLCDVDFRVGQLPQEKIAEAHFAAGSHDQIRIRQPARVEMLADQLLVYFQMIQAAIAGRRFGHRTKRIDDLTAGAIVE